jgi:hypothetical protein
MWNSGNLRTCLDDLTLESYSSCTDILGPDRTSNQATAASRSGLRPYVRGPVKEARKCGGSPGRSPNFCSLAVIHLHKLVTVYCLGLPCCLDKCRSIITWTQGNIGLQSIVEIPMYDQLASIGQ